MIDFKDENIEKPIAQGSYPSDYVKIGEGDDDFKIFVCKETIEDVKGYLSSDKSKELGGILLGDVYSDDFNKPFIIINNIVIARYTEANVTRLTFTHKSWEDINNTIEKEYPGKKILGWFHSHPGHTVFLSTYDKFIQENFFNRKFMVAYVYDPINNEEGFFCWKNKDIIKSDCYYLFSDFRTNENAVKSKNKDTFIEKKTKKGNAFSSILLLIAILSIIISTVLFFKYLELNRQVSDLNDINVKLNELKEINKKLNEKINELTMTLENRKDTNFVTTDNILKYQIKPGDSLKKIAFAFYQDEGKYNLLIRYNNLKDENDIAVGKVIEIPLGETNK